MRAEINKIENGQRKQISNIPKDSYLRKKKINLTDNPQAGLIHNRKTNKQTKPKLTVLKRKKAHYQRDHYNLHATIKFIEKINKTDIKS